MQQWISRLRESCSLQSIQPPCGLCGTRVSPVPPTSYPHKNPTTSAAASSVVLPQPVAEAPLPKWLSNSASPRLRVAGSLSKETSPQRSMQTWICCSTMLRPLSIRISLDVAPGSQGHHITLLGCVSETTVNTTSNEPWGLVPALMHQGASSLLSALWPTDDWRGCDALRRVFLQRLLHQWRRR